MGLNTTVVILNDSLNQIEKDSKFGENLARAIRGLGTLPVMVPAGDRGQAAMVVDCHHADDIHMIAVGGNRGDNMGFVGTYRESNEALLKTLADKMGYRLVKKSKR